MKKVQVLLSTYNGRDLIRRQVESILNQKDVEVNILIRDDGSKQDTRTALLKIQEDYFDRVRVVFCENIGWKRSFIELLFMAEEYDYYCFSDQDDVWLPEKLIKCIEKIESDSDYHGAKLVHCNSVCTDRNLAVRKEQQYRYPMPGSHKMAIAQEYFQGCGMVWNTEAMRLVKMYKPSEEIAHDYWVGVLCYFFGKIYYIEEPLFYHIRYENNASSDGKLLSGRYKRVKTFFKQKSVYTNPGKDFLTGYSEKLSRQDFVFLKKCADYKKNFKSKLSLIFDLKFKREHFMSTLFFKISILFNKY